MLRDVPTRALLVLGFLAAALVPLVLVALVSYEASRAALKTQAFAQLESTRALKRAEIERAFEERLHDVSLLAHDPYVARTFGELCGAYRAAGGAAGHAFAGHDRRGFDAPAEYRAVHERHAPYLARWVDEQGYYDLLLLDARSGESCFSVQKESDFATVVAEQPTSLRDVWREATRERRAALSDTRPYPPSANAAAQFVAAPIFAPREGAEARAAGEGDASRVVMGVVALQISIDSIDRVMGERAGMGRTGDSYLLGPDRRLRSDSQLDRARTVEASFRGEVTTGAVDEEATRRALGGETGSGILRERDGRTVLAAWAPVKLGGTTWAIVVVHGESEIDAQIARALDAKLGLLFLGACAVGGALALLASLAVSRAVRDATTQVDRLSDAVLAGDLTARGDPDAVAHDLRAVVRRVNGLVDALVKVNDDKRRLEERIGRMQRLEAIGTLAGGIAHDFNNILTSMFAHVDIMEGELARAARLTRDTRGTPDGREQGDARTAASLRQLDAGLQRAAELVRQILTFSRKLNVAPRPIDLGVAAREAEELVAAGLPKNVRLVGERPDRRFPVRADPTQMHQVIVNLLINASQALGDDGGEVALSLSEETIAAGDGIGGIGRTSSHGSIGSIGSKDALARRDGAPGARVSPALPAGQYCVLTVRDGGCGMDADTIARIFEPFFTTKPVGQGTGMGLALVHGVVTSAAGAVLVESAFGHGSTFRIYLPRCEEPLETSALGALEAANVAPPQPNGRRVLFIDDEEQVCQAAQQMLAALGHRATTACGGRAGIDAFLARPTEFDAVVTDLSMPDVGGLEVVAAVHAARPELPVILSTAFPDRLTQERANEVGFAAVLLKPYRRSALARVLAETLARGPGDA